MIPEEFAKQVFSRWPYKKQRDEEELKAIAADLATFANGKTSEVLEPILEEFIELKVPAGFGMWWFYKKVSRDNNTLYWRTCDNSHIYEDKGSCCPVCGSFTFSLTTGKVMPMETVQIQESCCQCKWYKESLSNPVDGLDGSDCRHYGTDENGTLIECNQCKCIKCCEMAYLYVHNPVKYRHLAGDLIKKKYQESGFESAVKKAEEHIKIE